MSFTTYITTWGNDPLQQIQDMINKDVLKGNTTRIVLAFASFNFDSTSYIPGFGNISMNETKQITNLVHSVGSKISLSIGGATYPFYNSDLYSRPGDLAYNINTIVNNCGFDGVDFDIEDSASNVPSDFTTTAASLINTLRSLNPGLYISLTTAAQAWSIGCYQQQLINLTIGNLDAWQPMEYDLWIGSGYTYYSQILYDLQFYTSVWCVNPSKIIVGLMPGNDDIGRDLTLQDALNITDYALSTGVKGMMTWNANIDGEGVDGNSPYAYCNGMQSMLKKTSFIEWFNHINKLKNKGI
jgi:chitinase